MSIYLMGIDIGTSESKGVITDKNGNCIFILTISHKTSILHPGWLEQDADRIWWHDFCYLSKNLIINSKINSKDIGGVTCSTMAPCVLPVDRNGKPLRPGILYGVDTRAYKEVDLLNQLIGEEVLLNEYHNLISSQSMAPKILWIKNNEPDIYKKTHKFLDATGYIVYKLTGNYFIDHFKASTGVIPLYDFSKLGWNSTFSEIITPTEKLPTLAWASDRAGSVTQDASRATGLMQGTPIMVGTGDAGAEALSVGLVDHSQLFLMYGSTFFFIKITDSLKSDSQLWSSVYLFPDTYCVMGGMSTTGELTKWFRNNFGYEELEQEKETGISAYASLAKKASEVNIGSSGLITLPYFSGERSPINDPLAKGLIIGLTTYHTKAHVYRSLLEGTGYSMNQNLKILEQLSEKTETILAAGGGTKNKLWLEIISDVTGVDQLISTKNNGASYGDCFLSALGIGLYKNYTDINKWVNIDQKIFSSKENQKIYSQYYNIFLDMYPKNKELMHKLSSICTV